MKRIHLVCLILFCTTLQMLVACSHNDSKQKNEKENPSADTTAADLLQPSAAMEINTSSGKTIIVEESHPIGASLSDFSVYFKGDTTTRLSSKDQDPMSSHLLADLDGNGFDELYVITTSAGSGSYGNVCGFASNKDQSFSLINFPELNEQDIAKGGSFEGYEGKDSYGIKGQRLIRRFQVDEKGEKKMKSIHYTLQKTEAGFALVPGQ
jgi:hypothetical protein